MGFPWGQANPTSSGSCGLNFAGIEMADELAVDYLGIGGTLSSVPSRKVHAIWERRSCRSEEERPIGGNGKIERLRYSTGKFTPIFDRWMV